jgi:inosose dehydratase
VSIRTATAPGSWGVEPGAAKHVPAWQDVLDEVAECGFDGVELGPVGYLPEQPNRLRSELRSRGLDLAGGFVMEPFHRRAARLDVLAVARRTCSALAAGGAERVVLIESLEPARSAAAGRPAAAPSLDVRGWRTLVATVTEVAALAAAEFGLRAAFHPHAGTFVENADEIDRLLDAVDEETMGLCLDTGHALYAGLDPTDLVRHYGRRLWHVHLKDVRADALERARRGRWTFERAVEGGVFCRLGDGDVDLEAVARALAVTGYDGWATFEQDRIAGVPGAFTDAAASLAHLRRIGIATARETVQGRPA